MATTQLELWTAPQRAEIASKPSLRPPQKLSPEEAISSPAAGGRGEMLDALRRQVARMETGGRQPAEGKISWGSAALDRLFPSAALVRGTLTEWIEHTEGSGAGWLSLVAARSALRGSPAGESISGESIAGEPSSEASTSESAGRLVVIDPAGTFYPPAAMAAGIPLGRIVIVRPTNRAEMIWAADQALRNPAVSVVWMRIDALDDRDARRLQLAAEVGKSLGLLVRPGRALGDPSWAEVRWFVRGVNPPHQAGPARAGRRYLEVRLVRCRGGRSGTNVILAIDSAGRISDETFNRKTAAVPLVAQLAHPAVAQSARRRLA